jgi:hypothetical protein
MTCSYKSCAERESHCMCSKWPPPSYGALHNQRYENPKSHNVMHRSLILNFTKIRIMIQYRQYTVRSATEETGLASYIGWHVSPQLPCPSPLARVQSFTDSLTSVSLQTHIYKNTVKRWHKRTVLYNMCCMYIYIHTPNSIWEICVLGCGISGSHNGSYEECTILWDIKPCSPTLKMEAICFFETSVDFQRTTRNYIPEDSTLYALR